MPKILLLPNSYSLSEPCLIINQNSNLDKGTLSSLLEKFRQGTCTKEEQELLYKWLDALEQEQEQDTPTFSNVEMQRIKEDMQQQIWPLPVRQPRRIALKAAAVIVPLLIASYFLRPTKQGRMKLTAALELKIVRNNSGNMQKLVLPDNSVVLLGPHCTIQFPPQFPENTRPVNIIEGKAFFETVTDSKRPFTVEDNNGTRTTVLGTSFIVETNHSFSRIAVATGKVKVQNRDTKSATLGPAQRFTINQQTTVQDSVDTSDLLAWTKGEIVLRNATLHELLLTIKTQYGVNTTTTLDVNKGNYTLRFPASMTLMEVLDIVEKISYKPKIHFTMQKDKLIVGVKQ